MNKIVSCYFPYRVNNNPYAKNIMNILKEKDIEVIPFKTSLISLKNMKKCKIYNLNWFENIEQKTKNKQLLEYITKSALLIWLKLNRKKIIYTLHNRVPHNSSGNKFSLLLMRKLVKYSDRIVIMCKESFEVLENLELKEKDNNKIYKIIHPSYFRNYDLSIKENLRNKFKIKDEDLVFMFIGSISPYKNIELLIDVFKENFNAGVKLLIVGKPCSSKYKEQLINQIGSVNNIVTVFEYIPDEMIVRYYNTCDVVVLPYSKKSSLNSGAIHLSFTLGKTVTCPNIGSIKELTDTSFVYKYDYNSQDEHKMNLSKILIKIYNEYSLDHTVINKKGQIAQNYLKINHSDAIISKLYYDLYYDLSKE